MNTLTGIEAERVNQILKLATDRLQILSYVPLIWDDDIYSEVSEAVIATSLEKLWNSDDQLNEIIESGGTDGGKELHAIKQSHKAAKDLCRNLMAHRPSLQVFMDRPESNQSEEFVKFIKYFNELKSQVNTRLTTTVEDEAANRTLLHDLTERERKMEESKEALQAKLNEVREERDRVSFQLDQTLRKTQLELQELRQYNSVELDAVQKEMNDSITKSNSDHELRMKQLKEQIDAAEKAIAEAVERNNEEEHRLRKEKNRTEKELAVKITQYDDNMRSKQQELNELTDNFNKENQEYLALKEYFDKVDADLARASDEEKILQAVTKRVEFVQYIQKIVRGRQARNIVNKLKSKNKKGGKKGKKK